MHVTTYERVVDGEVVERVTPIDGSHEDTRIGVLVLEGGSSWRVAGTEPAVTELADASTASGAAIEAPATESPSGPQDDESTAPATPDQPADAGKPTEEVDDGAATTDGNGAGAGGDKPRGSRRGG